MFARPIVYVLLLCSITYAQTANRSSQTLRNRAEQEFRNNDWPAAERDLRVIIEHEPESIFARFYLGQALFRQEKYAEAAQFFQKTRDLQKSGKTLDTTQDRILTDQLVMSYGITSQLKKAHALLEDAIGRDPDYPLNYYNRACAFAEEGDKTKMLADLDRAFARKANVLAGEQLPDPRTDSSFQKYLRDPEFAALVKKFGFR